LRSWRFALPFSLLYMMMRILTEMQRPLTEYAVAQIRPPKTGRVEYFDAMPVLGPARPRGRHEELDRHEARG
jgi:hypothetical protein